MKSLIKDMIAKDMEAQRNVAEVKQQCMDAKQSVLAQKESLMKEKKAELQKQLDDMKKEEESALEMLRNQRQTAYKTASHKLHQEFETKKSQWLQDLTNQCIQN